MGASFGLNCIILLNLSFVTFYLYFCLLFKSTYSKNYTPNLLVVER